MEFFALDGAAPADAAACTSLFQGHTLLLPAVSFANLGQLSLDLLVNSLLQRPDGFPGVELKHVGHLLTANVPPMTGGPAFATQGADSLSLNLQVYSSATSKITIVQQRTATMPGRARAFAEELVQWAAESKVAKLCVVAGADDMLRHDPNMLRRPIRTIYSGDSAIVNSELLAKFASLTTSPDAVPATEAPSQDAWKSVRGAGIAPLLHDECEQRSVPFVAWVMACAEGNNVPDAAALASELVQYLSLAPPYDKQNPQPIPFAFPPSWSQLFGRRPDVSLYL